MRITDFFNTDFVDYSSYDNLRKIASAIDGQKNAARKILFTVLNKNIKDKIKVSQLGSKVAEFSEYLHGNLDGVIVNLAQDFVGTNNIPMLQKKGNFGTRFTPEASASRYIYTYGSQEFFELFKKEDNPILKHQKFEGNDIEPMFYVPSLPVLLINGAEGVSSGFAQKILPRNPKDVIKYIKAFLDNRKTNILIPFYNGFNGTIEEGINKGQWKIKGVLEKIGINKVKITEIPIGYNLKTYIKVLDTLEDKKIIQTYHDKSEDDNFLFEVTIPSKTLKEISDDELYEKLKLIKTVTENYTVMDENNNIRVFNSAEDVLNYYIEVKLKYLQFRKDYLIKKLTSDCKLELSKYLFIKNIVDDQLKINQRKKADVIADIEKIPNIIKKDDSYDYLINLPIMSLTKERMEKIIEIIKAKKNELEILKKQETKDIWLSEF